jgi:hypothetical protein
MGLLLIINVTQLAFFHLAYEGCTELRRLAIFDLESLTWLPIIISISLIRPKFLATFRNVVKVQGLYALGIIAFYLIGIKFIWARTVPFRDALYSFLPFLHGEHQIFTNNYLWTRTIWIILGVGILCMLKFRPWLIIIMQFALLVLAIAPSIQIPSRSTLYAGEVVPSILLVSFVQIKNSNFQKLLMSLGFLAIVSVTETRSFVSIALNLIIVITLLFSSKKRVSSRILILGVLFYQLNYLLGEVWKNEIARIFDIPKCSWFVINLAVAGTVLTIFSGIYTVNQLMGAVSRRRAIHG